MPPPRRSNTHSADEPMSGIWEGPSSRWNARKLYFSRNQKTEQWGHHYHPITMNNVQVMTQIMVVYELLLTVFGLDLRDWAMLSTAVPQSGHIHLLHGNSWDIEVGFCTVQEFEGPEYSKWFQNTELHQNSCILMDEWRFLDLSFSFFPEMTRS